MRYTPALLAVLALPQPGVPSAALHRAEAADLCSVLKRDEVPAIFGAGWTYVSAKPLGGDNTCYYTLQAKTRTYTFGIKVDPAAGFDASLKFLNGVQPVTGLGERAAKGKLGGSTSLLVLSKGKTVSFGGNLPEALLEPAARRLLDRI